MADTFFSTLKALEKQNKDQRFENEKARILEKLIQFIVSGDFTNSSIEAFISKNFRLSVVALTREWNNSHVNQPKKADTFRCQKSLLSRFLCSLFLVTPDSLNNVFLGEDEEALYRINDIIDAFEDGNKNETEQFKMLLAINPLLANTKTKAEYELSDCINEVRLLKTLSDRNIANMVSKADMDKLIYVVHSIRQPLIETAYENVEGRKRPIKKAKVNLHKLKFVKAFAGTDAVEIEEAPVKQIEQGVVEADIEQEKISEKLPYKLGLTGELQSILADYVKTYETLPSSKKSQIYSRSNENTQKKAENFLRLFTVDGFKEALKTVNVFDLAFEIDNYKED